MTNSEQVVRKQQPASQQQTVYMPDVDILEDGAHITLLADIPGASRDEVEVSVENGILTLDAKPTMQAPDGYKLVGQEWDYGTFHRTFQLSDAVQVDGITATAKQGVLILTIPKRDEVRTRKIKIGT